MVVAYRDTYGINDDTRSLGTRPADLVQRSRHLRAEKMLDAIWGVDRASGADPMNSTSPTVGHGLWL